MINTPDKEIALPQDVANAVKKAKDLVTLNYAEAERLKGIVSSQEYKLIEIGKEIKTSESLLTSLNTSIGKANEKISELNKTIDELTANVVTLTKRDKDLTVFIDKKKADLSQKEEFLSEKEKEILATMNEHNEEYKKFSARVSLVTEKEKRIKDFANNL